ncbi:MAG: hypothetical protein M1839_005667 [Geoglossum umbratile]|nr:MAG: hypothetical protein M1839_005667 [Geoglossum umbratile]
MTGILRSKVAHLDGFTEIKNNSQGAQVGWQIADAVCGIAWAFTFSFLILCGMEVLRMAVGQGRDVGEVFDETDIMEPAYTTP